MSQFRGLTRTRSLVCMISSSVFTKITMISGIEVKSRRAETRRELDLSKQGPTTKTLAPVTLLTLVVVAARTQLEILVFPDEVLSHYVFLFHSAHPITQGGRDSIYCNCDCDVTHLFTASALSPTSIRLTATNTGSQCPTIVQTTSSADQLASIVVVAKS